MNAASIDLEQFGANARMESGISARTLAPNNVQAGRDNGLLHASSSGVMLVSRDLPKWLCIKDR